jgi:hypothetical protein
MLWNFPEYYDIKPLRLKKFEAVYAQIFQLIKFPAFTKEQPEEVGRVKEIV